MNITNNHVSTIESTILRLSISTTSQLYELYIGNYNKHLHQSYPTH